MDGEVGMALKAMEYWRCAETGVQAAPDASHEPTLKFVVAESLHGKSSPESLDAREMISCLPSDRDLTWKR